MLGRNKGILYCIVLLLVLGIGEKRMVLSQVSGRYHDLRHHSVHVIDIVILIDVGIPKKYIPKQRVGPWDSVAPARNISDSAERMPDS